MAQRAAGAYCKLAGGGPPPEGFDDALVCGTCHNRVPVSAAFTFDGIDYVWHFCGHDALAAWCRHAGKGTGPCSEPRDRSS